MRYQETQKNVGVKCRQDVRPSVRLLSVAGVDSKLGHRASSEYKTYALSSRQVTSILRRFLLKIDTSRLLRNVR